MAKKKIAKSKPAEQKIASAKIKWVIPDNVVTKFATNMLVQSMEDKEIKLLFFEAKLPIILDPSAPPPQEVPVECVASIIIDDRRMPTFIEALQKHFEAHESAKKKS